MFNSTCVATKYFNSKLLCNVAKYDPFTWRVWEHANLVMHSLAHMHMSDHLSQYDGAKRQDVTIENEHVTVDDVKVTTDRNQLCLNRLYDMWQLTNDKYHVGIYILIITFIAGSVQESQRRCTTQLITSIVMVHHFWLHL